MLKKIFSLLNYPSTAVLSAPGVSAAFARTLTDKNNPDHIILAHILQSFATEFDAWTIESVGYSWPKSFTLRKYKADIHSRSSHNSGERTYRLARKEGASVAVECRISQRSAYSNDDFNDVFFTDLTANRLLVNATSLSIDLCLPFLEAVTDLKKKVDDAKAIAAKAKAEMEANEKKWELAESLLGMKRDDTGLLVAKSQSCGCFNRDFSNIECICK